MPKEGASVKSLSTSIEIRHVFGRTPRRYDESDERYERRQAPRKYFVKPVSYTHLRAHET